MTRTELLAEVTRAATDERARFDFTDHTWSEHVHGIVEDERRKGETTSWIVDAFDLSVRRHRRLVAALVARYHTALASL